MYPLIAFIVFGWLITLSEEQRIARVDGWKSRCKEAGGQVLETSSEFFCMKDTSTVTPKDRGED
jgi:hypothetical protein